MISAAAVSIRAWTTDSTSGIKEDEVLRLMAGKGVAAGKADPIEGCPSQYRYRNKMEYTFGDFEKGGPLYLRHAPQGKFHVHNYRGQLSAGGRGFQQDTFGGGGTRPPDGLQLLTTKSHKGLFAQPHNPQRRADRPAPGEHSDLIGRRLRQKRPLQRPSWILNWTIR